MYESFYLIKITIIINIARIRSSIEKKSLKNKIQFMLEKVKRINF